VAVVVAVAVDVVVVDVADGVKCTSIFRIIK